MYIFDDNNNNSKKERKKQNAQFSSFVNIVNVSRFVFVFVFVLLIQMEKKTKESEKCEDRKSERNQFKNFILSKPKILFCFLVFHFSEMKLNLHYCCVYEEDSKTNVHMLVLFFFFYFCMSFLLNNYKIFKNLTLILVVKQHNNYNSTIELCFFFFFKTFAGTVLVAVNPYENLSIYDDSVANIYRDSPTSSNPALVIVQVLIQKKNFFFLSVFFQCKTNDEKNFSALLFQLTFFFFALFFYILKTQLVN